MANATAEPEVALYLQAATEGVASLLQDLPLVGIVAKIFLLFTHVVETATSNKDDLTELQELCNLVIKGVLQQRREQKKTGADDEFYNGFEMLRQHIEKATDIAKRCRGNAVKQFLFSRRTSKDIAAIRKSVLGLCTANTLLLSASMHAKLNSMSQIWTEKDKRFDSMEEELELLGSSESESQELRKAPRVKVPGCPKTREWYVDREAVVFDACEGLGVGSSYDASEEPRMVGLGGPGGAGKSTVASMVVTQGPVQQTFRKRVLWLPVGKGAKNRLEALMLDLAVMVYETVMHKRCRPPRKANVQINPEDGAAYIREVVDESNRPFLVVADDVWDVEVLEELKKAGAWVLYTTRQGSLLPGAPPLRLDQVLKAEAEMILRRAAELDDDAPLPEAAYEVMKRCEFVVLDLVLVGRRGEVRERCDERAWRNVLGRITEAQGEGGQLRSWRAAALRAGLGVLAGDNPLNKELYLALALLPTGLAFPSKVAGVLLCGDDCSTEALKTANKVLEVLERLSILVLEAGGKYRVDEDHVDFVWDCLKTNRETLDAALPRWRKYISSVEALDTYATDWLARMWNVLAQVEGGAVAPSPYEATLDALGPSSPKLPKAVRKVAEFHFERRDWLEAYNKYFSLLSFEEDAVNGHGLPEAKILHRLGMCASEMPGYEEKTVKLLRQALKIQERTLGNDHPHVAKTLHALGVCASTNPGVAFGYEVAVCGGIPMIEKDASQDDHSGSKVLKASGFMNATTKFILEKTEREGADLGDLLAQARGLGHAEEDIRRLLAELVFGATVSSDSIEPKGISPLIAVDLEYARKMQSIIKLQGTAMVSPEGDRLSVSVSPVVVPLHHSFASTEDLGSIISVDSQEWENETRISAGFYVRITCRDKLGIVRRVGRLAEANGVSIRAIHQNDIVDAANVIFVVTTDPCKQSQVNNLSASIAKEDWAKGVPLVMSLL